MRRCPSPSRCSRASRAAAAWSIAMAEKTRPADRRAHDVGGQARHLAGEQSVQPDHRHPHPVARPLRVDVRPHGGQELLLRHRPVRVAGQEGQDPPGLVGRLVGPALVARRHHLALHAEDGEPAEAADAQLHPGGRRPVGRLERVERGGVPSLAGHGHPGRGGLVLRSGVSHCLDGERPARGDGPAPWRPVPDRRPPAGGGLREARRGPRTRRKGATCPRESCEFGPDTGATRRLAGGC
jgi:hypothetical protein